ncbi:MULTISPECIES: amino acid ABC transporter permease [Geobacillus]|uniref:amino acid ABC transporter permease n=1 Tax=Geobacillus TaxID=129337 RepID=UPI0015761F4F|nr:MULTISPECIES: amino acid ABC transporter permease [Geobacillus]MED3719108.1 amino acid ABC transporter permease [Geobacillus thermodenitrificans]MED3906936.1 amino acid ABC transporter permease [Geobacillus thermodenitrificans]MED4916482.1 amino acid ABC transporter permease [Geobacillus thermodenitrificans]
MQTIVEVFHILSKGIQTTLLLLITSAFFAFIIAIIAGLGRLAKSRWIRWTTNIYVEFFRGTSLVVQLFWVYYALPMLAKAIPFLPPLNLSSFWAGVIAVSLNYGAYVSETVRSCILAVDRGQHEAAIALNMTRFQRMRLVILPQAVRMMLPDFGNNLIQMLKSTSLVSLIGLTDITYAGMVFRNSNIDLGILVFAMMLVFYFLIALPLIWLTRRAERAVSKGMAS